MKIFTIECTPGYQPSGVSAAFPPAHKTFAHTPVRMRQLLLAGSGNGVDVQTVITDVPDHRSALSSVRRT